MRLWHPSITIALTNTAFVAMSQVLAKVFLLACWEYKHFIPFRKNSPSVTFKWKCLYNYNVQKGVSLDLFLIFRKNLTYYEIIPKKFGRIM